VHDHSVSEDVALQDQRPAQPFVPMTGEENSLRPAEFGLRALSVAPEQQAISNVVLVYRCVGVSKWFRVRIGRAF
jgi:hypothetical protein